VLREGKKKEKKGIKKTVEGQNVSGQCRRERSRRGRARVTLRSLGWIKLKERNLIGRTSPSNHEEGRFLQHDVLSHH